MQPINFIKSQTFTTLKIAVVTAAAILIVKLLNTLLVYHFFNFDYYLAVVAISFFTAGYYLLPVRRKEKIEPGVLSAVVVVEEPLQPSNNLKTIFYTLTNREVCIFKLLAQGKTNKEMAADLNVELNTIKTHIKNLYKKTGCNNRQEARKTWDKMVEIGIIS